MITSNDTQKHSGYSTKSSESRSHTPGSSSPSCSVKSNLSNSQEKNGTNSSESLQTSSSVWKTVKKTKKWKWITNGKETHKYNIEPFLDLKDVVITDFDGVDGKDYPDFCDAFASEATYGERKMNEKELDLLNDEYSEFVYEKLMDHLF